MKISRYALFTILLLSVISCKHEGKDQTHFAQLGAGIAGAVPSHFSFASIFDNDGPFEVKSGIVEYTYRNENRKETRHELIHFDNYGRLVKIEENFQGKKQTMVFNKATNRGFRFFEGARMATKSGQTPQISGFIVKPDLIVGYSETEPEWVAGAECRHFKKDPSEADPTMQADYWIYKGIVLKSKVYMGTYSEIEAVRFDETDLDPDVFKAPTGVSVPYDIFE
ncbi:MAG: hypothetical protein H6581_03605 [Bacteroidia bacterium]|nr:hypothetical protein [Bacteroidia bacterium]